MACLPSGRSGTVRPKVLRNARMRVLGTRAAGRRTTRTPSRRRTAEDDSRRHERERREEERRKRREEEERARPRILTPYEILGIAEGASRAEVKKRFHFLAVQYHPDKVHHMGVEFQEHAHEKFVALQEAYRDLMARRDD